MPVPSNIDDINNFQAGECPLAAEWCIAADLVSGYPFKTHVDWVRAGYRFLPSVRWQPPSWTVNGITRPNDKQQIAWSAVFRPEDFAYMAQHNLAFCLRTNNTAEMLVNSFRNDKEPMNGPNIVRDLPPLDGTPIADPLADTEWWRKFGEVWATTPTLLRAQAEMPNPTWIMTIANDEAGDAELKAFCTRDGYVLKEWKTNSELTLLNIRLRDAPRPALPEDYVVQWTNFHAEQHFAMYRGFNAAVAPGWQAKIIFGAYGGSSPAVVCRDVPYHPEIGYAPEATYRNGLSPEWYLAPGTWANFCGLAHYDFLNLRPMWKWHNEYDPSSWRELSFTSQAGTLYGGAAQGIHELITPERLDGYVGWLLWGMQDPEMPVLIREYVPSATKQTALKFPIKKPGDTVDHQAALAAISGGEALKNLTFYDYTMPVLEAVNRIGKNETLRRFWKEGIAVVAPGEHPSYVENPKFPGLSGMTDDRCRQLECDCNSPRSTWEIPNKQNPAKPPTLDPNARIKVWTQAVRIKTEILLYLWSPCIMGAVTVEIPTVGKVTVDMGGRPWGYWIISDTTSEKIAADAAAAAKAEEAAAAQQVATAAFEEADKVNKLADAKLIEADAAAELAAQKTAEAEAAKAAAAAIVPGLTATQLQARSAKDVPTEEST